MLYMSRHLIIETLSSAVHHLTDAQIEAIDLHITANNTARLHAERKNTLPPFAISKEMGDSLLDDEQVELLLNGGMRRSHKLRLVGKRVISAATILTQNHAESSSLEYLHARKDFANELRSISDGVDFHSSGDLHTDMHDAGVKILIAKRAFQLTGHDLPVRVVERQSFASVDDVRSSDAVRVAFSGKRHPQDNRGNLTVIPLSSTLYATSKPCNYRVNA